MPVNPYFRHINAGEEQDLYHDLAREFIQLAGVDVYYISSNALDSNYDSLFGENRLQTLTNATQIECYIKNIESPYQGDNLYSKFGLHMNESTEFLFAYRRFEEVFAGRPKEGDFIYIPQWEARGPDDVFRISFVDTSGEQWETMGTSYFYHVKAQRAKFSHETYNTGLPAVDDQVLSDMESTPGTVDKDRNADNLDIQSITDAILNFDEQNPFGEV